MGKPLCPDNFLLVTKHGTPLCKKKYCIHLWWNREPLMALLLNEETLIPRQFTPVTKHGIPYAKKILHPFETKSGTPHGLVAKWGNPYAQTIYPCDETWNPLCNFQKSRNELSLAAKFFICKIRNPDIQTLKTIAIFRESLIALETLWKA